MSTEFIPNKNKILESQFDLSFSKKTPQIHIHSHANKNYVFPNSESRPSCFSLV